MKAAGIVSAFVLSGVLLSSGSAALAQTSIYKEHTHGADIHDSAFVTENMSRWSLGGEWMQMSRTVKLDNGPKIDLEPSITSVNVGFDVTRWMKVYAGYGQSGFFIEDPDDTKIFGGLKFNWWHNDITDPSFMYGRLSLQSTAEYAHFLSGAAPDPTRQEWNELYADFTVNYESIMVHRITDVWRYWYSWAIYGGPAFSSISGSDSILTRDASGGRSYVHNQDFSQADSVGMTAGADLFFSHNFALGFSSQFFSGVTLNAVTLRYHFH